MTPWNSRKNRRSILITNCSEAIHRSTPDHSLPGDRQHSSEFWSAQRIDRLVPTSVPSFLPPLVRTSPPRQPRGQRPTVNSLSFSLFNLVFHKPLSLSLSFYPSRHFVITHYRVPLALSSTCNTVSVLPFLSSAHSHPPGSSSLRVSCNTSNGVTIASAEPCTRASGRDLWLIRQR